MVSRCQRKLDPGEAHLNGIKGGGHDLQDGIQDFGPVNIDSKHPYSKKSC